MEQKHPIAWHVPNLINICIDSVEDGEMTGKIYHCYSEEAIAFSNIRRSKAKKSRMTSLRRCQYCSSPATASALPIDPPLTCSASCAR